MKIADGVFYVGVNDRDIDLFESQYRVPNGMAYNSYIIKDEKTAVFDTVGEKFGAEWLGNVKRALGGAKPDYLIVQHMEPDHSANIGLFAEEFPEALIVGNAKTFNMMDSFYAGLIPNERRIAAADGGTLELGLHTLKFLFAPMVHWPEVMVTYDEYAKVLFSADAFGKFGALDADEPWEDEARRYYFGIVGKYGAQVQGLLKKTAALEIGAICPLHGPALVENIDRYTGLYGVWSSYAAEERGALIAYTSVYGHTKAAALELAARLEKSGVRTVQRDLSRDDMAAAVADAFRFDRTVFATTTYNAGIFPPMQAFLDALTERGFRCRRVGVIENGSWAPTAAKAVKEKLAACKDLVFCNTTVTVKSALSDQSREQINALADELCR